MGGLASPGLVTRSMGGSASPGVDHSVLGWLLSQGVDFSVQGWSGQSGGRMVGSRISVIPEIDQLVQW